MVASHLLMLACALVATKASDSVISDKIDFGNSSLVALGALKGTIDVNISFTNPNDEEVTNVEHQHQLNYIGYLLLSSFLLVLSAVLVLLLWNIVRARHVLFDNESPRASRSMKQRIQRRYETIEHWIITKTAQVHDNFSDTVVDNFGHHKDNTGGSADPTAEEDADQPNPVVIGAVVYPSRLEDSDEPRECPICMSVLKAGQTVSWSANEKCNHTYHHECIKEWLLRHVDCCLCKEVFLPVDEKKGRAKQAALQELSCRYAASSATSFFCEKRGLVRIPRSVRCTRAELGQLEQRIFGGTVPPTDLINLRGGRDCTTTCNDDDLPPIEELIRASTAETLSYDGEDGENERIIGVSPDNASSPGVPTVTDSLPFSPVRIPNSVDVELGAELLSASYHLEKNKSALGDNRCCVEDSDESVEVHETSSSGHIVDEEDDGNAGATGADQDEDIIDGTSS